MPYVTDAWEVLLLQKSFLLNFFQSHPDTNPLKPELHNTFVEVNFDTFYTIFLSLGNKTCVYNYLQFCSLIELCVANLNEAATYLIPNGGNDWKFWLFSDMFLLKFCDVFKCVLEVTMYFFLAGQWGI